MVSVNGTPWLLTKVRSTYFASDVALREKSASSDLVDVSGGFGRWLDYLVYEVSFPTGIGV